MLPVQAVVPQFCDVYDRALSARNFHSYRRSLTAIALFRQTCFATSEFITCAEAFRWVTAASALLSVGFSLDAKPAVNGGGNGGARAQGVRYQVSGGIDDRFKISNSRFQEARSAHLNQIMMENHELVRAQGARGVSAAFIVAELDFEHAGREAFDHGSHLAPFQSNAFGSASSSRGAVQFMGGSG